MNKLTRCLFLIALALFFSCPGVEASDVRMAESEGQAYIHLVSSGNEEVIAAVENAPLEAGDKIFTGKNSTARVVIEGESIVELGSETEFTVETSDEQGFGFFLAAGEIMAKIKGLLEKNKTLKVRTPVAVAAVRGTEFVVEHNPGADQSHMAVFDEGRLSIESFSTGEKAELVESQEATVARGLGRIRPGPLHRFEGRRERLQHLRERREFFRKNWTHRSPQDRQLNRKQLMNERRFRNDIRPQKKELEKHKEFPPKERTNFERRRPAERRR